MASGDWLVVCQGRRRALRFAWASMLFTFCLFCSWKRSLSVDDRVVTVLVVSCFFFRLFSFWSRFAGTWLRGSCPWQDAASRVRAEASQNLILSVDGGFFRAIGGGESASSRSWD